MPPKEANAAPAAAGESCSVTVAVRCRPFNEREKKAKSRVALDFPGGPKSIRIFPYYKEKDGTDTPDFNRGRNFTFDYCYQAAIAQRQLFLDLGIPVLNAAFAGFNTCIFAYGQTGSGKSFAMMGPSDAAHVLPQTSMNIADPDDEDNNNNSTNNEENHNKNPHEQDGSGGETGLVALRGIIPRLAERLFIEMEKRAEEHNKTKGENDSPLSFETSVTYLEIYQERIRDLLDLKKKDGLKVRVHPTQGVFVEDLTSKRVRSFAEIMHLISEGNDGRQVAATNMNERSSRSHAVFSIILRQTWSTKQTAEDGSDTESVSERRSQINLVDLAGSERAKATGAEGATLKEGALINKSLTTLGLVISGLADQAKGTASGKEAFIPYRDSSLTFLLKENLGGNSKTYMLSTLSPAHINYEETLSTLRYADRAKAIVTKAVINEDAKDRAIRELKAEIEKYQQDLGELQKLRELVAQQQLEKDKKQSSASSSPEEEGGQDEEKNAEGKGESTSSSSKADKEKVLSEDAEAAAKATAEAIAAREKLEIAESLIRKFEEEQSQGGGMTLVDLSATLGATAKSGASPTLVTSSDKPYLMNVEGAGNWAVMPLEPGTTTFFGRAASLEEALESLKSGSEDAQRLEEITNSMKISTPTDENNNNSNNIAEGENRQLYVRIDHAGVCPLHCCLTVEKIALTTNNTSSTSGQETPPDDEQDENNDNNKKQNYETKVMLRPFNAPDQFDDETAVGADDDASTTKNGREEAWTFIDADTTVYEDVLLKTGQTFQLGSEYVSVKFVDPVEASIKKKQEANLLGTSKLRARGKSSAMGNTARSPNGLDSGAVSARNTNNNTTASMTAMSLNLSSSSPNAKAPQQQSTHQHQDPEENVDENNNADNENNNIDGEEQQQQQVSNTSFGAGGIAIPKISIAQKRQMGPGPSLGFNPAVLQAAKESRNNVDYDSDFDSDDDDGLPSPAGANQKPQSGSPGSPNIRLDSTQNNNNGKNSQVASLNASVSGGQKTLDPNKQSQINVAFLGENNQERRRAAGPLAMTPRSAQPPRIQDPNEASKASSPLTPGNKPQQGQQQQKMVDEVTCIYKHTFVLLGDLGTGKTAFRNVVGKDFGFFEGLKSKVSPQTIPTMGYDVSLMSQAGGSTKADLTFFELSGRLQSMFAPLQVMIPDRRITFMLFFKLTDRVDVQYFKPYIEIMQRASPHNSTNLILVGTHRDEVILERGNGRESLATDDEIRQVMTEIQMEFADYARAFEPDETRRPRIAARYALSLKDRTALCTVVNPPVTRPDGTVLEAVVVEQSQKKMSELLVSMADHAVKVCRTDSTFTQGLIPTRLHRLYQEIFQERTRGKFMIEAADYKALAQRVDRRYIGDRGNADDLHKHTTLLHSWLTLHHHHRHALLKRSIIIDPMSVFKVVVVYCVAMAAARTMCFYRPNAVPPPAGSVRAAAETLLNHFGVENLPFSIPIVRSKDGLITSADDDPFRGEGVSIFLTLGGGIVSMPVARELFQKITRERGISVQACLNILCRFDLLLHADKVAVFMPNPEGVAENGLLGSLVSLQQAAEEQRGVNAMECTEEMIQSMKFFVAPLMFSRPASEALTLYVPSLLRWSGARTSRFSLNNVPYNLMGRLVCRLAHIADGVYVGPLPEIARNYTSIPDEEGTKPHQMIMPADQRPFWNDATWLISGYTGRVLVRLVSRSLFIFFLDLDTVLTCRESERFTGEAPEEEENCLPVAWMTSEAALNGINGGPMRFIADDQREGFADYIAQRCDAIWETPSVVQEDVLAGVRSVLHETPGVVFREYEQQRVEEEGMTDLARAPATARGSAGWVLKGQEGCGTARGPSPNLPAMVQTDGNNQQQQKAPSDKKSAAALAAAAAVMGQQVSYDSSGEATELDGTCSTRFSLDPERVQKMLANSVLLHDEEEVQLSVSLRICSVARNRLRLLEELWYLRHFAEGVEELPPPSPVWYDQWYELARGALADECAAVDALVDCLSAVRN